MNFSGQIIIQAEDKRSMLLSEQIILNRITRVTITKKFSGQITVQSEDKRSMNFSEQIKIQSEDKSSVTRVTRET